MSSVVHIDPAGRRDMDDRRDYLELHQARPRVAEVINFTPALEQMCSRCLRRGHRASRCAAARPA